MSLYREKAYAHERDIDGLTIVYGYHPSSPKCTNESASKQGKRDGDEDKVTKKAIKVYRSRRK